MQSDDYDHFYALTLERTGVVLGDEKRYLVDCRLTPIALREGVADVSALLVRLRAAPRPALVRRCVEAMVTHETSFFRDRAAFERLVAHLAPRLRDRPDRPLRVWSAACSTGQEAYSLAIALRREAPEAAVRIVATDLSERALDQARAGRYGGFEIQRGLDAAERERHFARVEADAWEATPELRAAVRFRAHNLLDDCSPFAPADVVLCRNVLIYFEPRTKAAVLERLAATLAPGGALMLGSSESLVGLGDAFEPIKGSAGLYAPRRAA